MNRPREAPCFETLEPRVLYSADPVSGAVTALLDDTSRLDAVVTQAPPPAASVEGASLATVETARREVIVVAANLPDADRLVSSLLASRGGDFELVMLAADRDALTQIGEVLAGADRPYDAVHLLTHAAPGRIDLGSSVGDRYLDDATLAARLEEISRWGGGFTADGDLLLYGCELAGSAAGQSLLADLGGLLGVDVAASTNPTGAAALGGDWALEYTFGEVAPGTMLAAAGWSFTLDTVTANVFTDVVDGNISSIAALIANPGSDGGISLREAVSAANATGAADTITLLAGTYTLNSQLLVNQHLGITGAGAGATFVDGGGNTRLFEVTNNSLLLEKLTLQEGAANAGAALLVGSGAGVTLEEVVLRDNAANLGGAVHSGGTLVATNVSFINNTASIWGGALYAFGGSAAFTNTTFSGNAASDGGAIYSNVALSLTSSTVAHNFVSDVGGGIFQGLGGNATLSNTLLEDNTGGNANRALVSAGFNIDSDGSAGLTQGTDLSNVAARLNPLSLAANGLYTHTLQNDSPAVDAGGGTFSATDAAGFVRNAIPDIGASENLAASQGKLYWAEQSQGKIVRANLDGSASQSVVVGLSAPRGFAIDVTSGHIYWTDIGTKSVHRANLDGSGQVTLVSDLLGPYGLDVDPAGGHLYFADDGGPGSNDFLRRVDLDGSNPVVVLTTSANIRGAAVAPGTEHGFATDAGSNTIFRVNLGDMSSVVIASGTSQAVNQALNIAVDAANSRVYWVNDGSDSIVRANFDGTGRTTILTGLADPQGFVVDPLAGLIYWSEKSTGQIGRADLDGGSVVRFSTGYTGLRDLDLFTFSAFNAAPSGADATLTILEDTPRTLAAADFGFTDPDGHPFDGVRVVSVPGAGSLTFDGVAVVAGQVVSAADLAAGKLVFTPAANANGAGYASFSFQVRDNGGTANGGVDEDPSPNTLTFDVTPVNDAPAGTDATLTILEDTPRTLTSADFGYTDIEGDAFTGVVIASLPLAGSLTFDGVAAVADQVVSAADLAAGKLVFTPAANANGAGYASFSFQVRDNGGTANGGVDEDPSPNTLTFDVTPVNDAPAGTDATVTILEDTPRTLTAADFGFTDIEGDAFTGVVIASVPLAGSLMLDGVAVTPGQFVGVADFSKLVFTPAVNAHGNSYASFTFQVRDNGGTANAGVDEDPTPKTLTFDVTPVNDAPAGTDATLTILEDSTRTLTAADFGFTDIEGDAFTGVVIASVPLAGSLTLDGAAVTPGQFVGVADFSKLVFTPAVNAHGNSYASFTFQVRDNGGTANAGVDEDPSPNTLTFDVTPVNDAPSGTDNAITLLEDTPYTLGAKDFGFEDIDGHAFAGVLIGKLDAAGSLTLDGAAVKPGQFVTSVQLSKGALVFTPGANEHGAGYSGFSFRVRDDGGLANGGAELAAAANKLVFHVKPVNDAPVGGDWHMDMGTERLVLRPSQFPFSDVDGQTLAAVRIDSLPAEGRLLLDGQPLAAGTVVGVADLAAGRLVFDAGSVSSRQVVFSFSVGDGLSFAAEPSRATLAFANPPAIVKAMQSMQATPQTAPAASAASADQSAATASTSTSTSTSTKSSATPAASTPTSQAATPTSPSVDAPSTAGAADNADRTGLDPMMAAAFALGMAPIAELRAMDAQAAVSAGAMTSSLESASLAALDRAVGAQLLSRLAQLGLDGRADIGALLAEIAEHARALDDGSGAQRALDARRAAATLSGALETPGFIETLDALREEEQLTGMLERSVIGTGVVASTGISVGYILYLLRGEFLLSGLLSSLPAWRMVDPLPVLSQLGDADGGDGESLEELVAGDGPAELLPEAGDDVLFAPVGDYA